MAETLVGAPDPEDNFYTEIANMMGEVLGIDPTIIQLDDEFGATIEADSLDVVEMGMAAEEKYGITITEEELREIKTPNQFADLIKKKVDEKGKD